MQAWIDVQTAAELEGVGRTAIQMRIDRGPLKARPDSKGRLLVKVADLSPQAQQRWAELHGVETTEPHHADAAERLASYPKTAREEAFAWLHKIRSAPDRGVKTWLKTQLLNGKPIPYRTFAYKRQALKELGPEGLINMRGRVKKEAIDERTQALISNFYLQDYRPSVAQVRSHLMAALGTDDVPSEGCIRRFIKTRIPHAAKVLARHGKKALENELPHITRDYYSVEPGEIYCSDHTQLNVAVRHPKNGTPFFPWLTVVSDIRSRKVVGWVVEEKPSGRTIAAACRHAFLQFSPPKQFMCDNGRDYSSRYLAGGQWRFRSKPHKVALDTETQGILTQLGIKVHYTLPYSGRSKPVERWFKTLKDRMEKLLPGYRGGSVGERPERLAKTLKNANNLLTLAAFRSLVDEFVDYYNNDLHQGHAMNGQTPDEVFNAEARKQYLVNPNTLTLLMMPAERRLVYSNGVSFMGGWYYDTALEMLRRETVCLRYDPQDVSRVAIFDVKGAFVCWATHQCRMSFNPTQEELASARGRQKTIEKSTEEFIAHARDSFKHEDLVTKIIQGRRAQAAQSAAKRTGSKVATRLVTDHDADAREMVVSEAFDKQKREGKVKKKVWGGPGIGWLEE